FDVGQVQGRGGIATPLYSLGIDVQEPVGIGQGLAQAVQQGAQIGVRLALGRIRPELESQLGARVRRRAMQQQIGQQRLQPWRVERREGCSVSGEVEAAQQLDV